MKDLDVTSNKQELANKDKDANLRWDNDPDETKRAVGSQNPAMMQKEICRWSWIVGLANQSHFYGRVWWDTLFQKKTAELQNNSSFPKASEARHPAGMAIVARVRRVKGEATKDVYGGGM